MKADLSFSIVLLHITICTVSTCIESFCLSPENYTIAQGMDCADNAVRQSSTKWTVSHCLPSSNIPRISGPARSFLAQSLVVACANNITLIGA